jgi:hypothetical protein
MQRTKMSFYFISIKAKEKCKISTKMPIETVYSFKKFRLNINMIKKLIFSKQKE